MVFLKFNNKKFIIVIIIFSGLICVPFLMTGVLNVYRYNITDPNYDNMTPRISRLSGKIHINNNWTDAKTAGICTGEGTSSNPYIIANLVIDAGGLGNCILIENSDLFFIIRNCTLTNSGSALTDSGVNLFNVINGEINTNTMIGNNKGIHLEDCDNCK